MRIKTILVSLLFSLTFSSCIISEGDSIKDLSPSNQGHNMYEHWNQSFTYRSAYLRKSFSLNAYIQAAGDDDAQFEILSNYFTLQHIRDFGDGIWGIYNGTQLLYKFNTHEKDLNENGAFWDLIASNVQLEENEYYINYTDVISGDSLDIRIMKSDEKTWSVYYEDEGNPANYQNTHFYFPETTSIPTDLLNSKYEINGEGRFIFRSDVEPIALDYEIISTMHANGFNNTWLWSAGSLELTSSNRAGKTRSTEASFFYTGNWYSVDITSDEETKTFDQ